MASGLAAPGRRIYEKKLPTSSLHPNYTKGAGKSSMNPSKIHEALANGESIVVGSMHTYTDGIGYGLARMGPASARFETPREQREKRWDKLWAPEDRSHKPDKFAHAEGWKHRGPRGHRNRSMEARLHTTSGEVGAWSVHEHPTLHQHDKLVHVPPRKRYIAPVADPSITAHIPTHGNDRLLTQMDPSVQPEHMVETLPIVTPKGVVPERVRAHITKQGLAASASLNELDMSKGKFDSLFPRQLKQDNTFVSDRDMFKRSMPAFDITAHSAFYQNDLSSSLTTDWSHSLRGLKY